MADFATTSDLVDRWRDLSVDEISTATALIGDATAKITTLCTRSGIDIADKSLTANLKAVTCSMVKRAMSTSKDMFGVTQQSQGAGVYSGSVTFSNPMGDLYLTKEEKNLLGLTRTRIGSIRPYIEGAEEW